MNKRGAGNVEFILAFVMFVSFLFLALYFFNPIRDLTSIESSKDYVLREIVSNASIELDSYSIVSSSSGPVEIEIGGIGEEKKVRVENYNGEPISSVRSGNKICFYNDEKFAVVHFSEDIALSEDIATCSGDSDSEISSSIIAKVISEKRILDLNVLYSKDYSELKEGLGIPANIDFSFILEFPNGGGKIESGEAIISPGSVYSETKIVEVLRTGGESRFGYLTIKVW